MIHIATLLIKFFTIEIAIYEKKLNGTRENRFLSFFFREMVECLIRWLSCRTARQLKTSEQTTDTHTSGFVRVHPLGIFVTVESLKWTRISFLFSALCCYLLTFSVSVSLQQNKTTPRDLCDQKWSADNFQTELG